MSASRGARAHACEEVSGELPMNDYVFVNKLAEDEPGYLAVGDPAGDHVRVEFEALLPDGGR